MSRSPSVSVCQTQRYALSKATRIVVAKQRGVSSFPTNLTLFISTQVSPTVIDLTYGRYIDEELPVHTGASSNE